MWGLPHFSMNEAFQFHNTLSFYKSNILRKINFTNEDIQLPTYQEIGFGYSQLPLSDNLLLSVISKRRNILNTDVMKF